MHLRWRFEFLTGVQDCKVLPTQSSAKTARPPTPVKTCCMVVDRLRADQRCACWQAAGPSPSNGLVDSTVTDHVATSEKKCLCLLLV